MPKIRYIGKDLKERAYHPDIFIPSENRIIEVKSTYTFNHARWKETNQLKRQACIDAGYNFEFWVCSSTKLLEIL